MDILTDSSEVTRLEVVHTGRRRRWRDAEKVRIVEESYSGPRRASATARRYGISNPLLFSWRKAYREGRLCAGQVSDGFVPALVVSGAGAPSSPAEVLGMAGNGGQMEVICRNGRPVVVGSDFDAQALGRLLELLEQR